MIICKLCDCSDANNKCKECVYSSICDYIWVSDVWRRNSELLTPLNPMYVKPMFRENHVITITREHDFCIFNVPKRTDTITIQDICVDEAARGQGISKKIINGLMEKYDRDIIAKCVKGSSAESFWSHIGEKIGEEPSKKRDLCIYKVLNKNRKQRKFDLF